jgi:hypothetical protein
MRSVATNSSVFSSISKISRTLPEAIFLMLYWLRSTLVMAVDDGGDDMVVEFLKRISYNVVIGVDVSVLFGVVVVSRVVS